MSSLIVFGLIGALILIWIVVVYNKLIQLKVLTDNSFSDIEVHLKKRHDLVPNLVETVKGYMSHEKETLESVIQARNKAVKTNNINKQIEAENTLSSLIPKIFALSEAYPDLKASPQFLKLQQELSMLENEIANARKYFNAVVRDYNTKQMVFPDVIIAKPFGFTKREFFQAQESEIETPTVKLS